MEDHQGTSALTDEVYWLISVGGTYYRDILGKLLHRHPQRTIDHVLASLVRHRRVRRVGSDMHPIYARETPHRVVYENIRPADGLGGLLVIHRSIASAERLLGKTHTGNLARPTTEHADV